MCIVYVRVVCVVHFFLISFSPAHSSLPRLGKTYYPGVDEHISEEAGGFGDGPTISMGSPARSSPQSQGSEVTERFSRKVFVGGLPPDIDEGKWQMRLGRGSVMVMDLV